HRQIDPDETTIFKLRDDIRIAMDTNGDPTCPGFEHRMQDRERVPGTRISLAHEIQHHRVAGSRALTQERAFDSYVPALRSVDVVALVAEEVRSNLASKNGRLQRTRFDVMADVGRAEARTKAGERTQIPDIQAVRLPGSRAVLDDVAVVHDEFPAGTFRGPKHSVLAAVYPRAHDA